MSLNMNNLRIFPASNRTENNQQNNNWLTEFNMSSFINQIVAPGKEGFVISGSGASGVDIKKFDNKPFKFNIAGYYFEISPDGEENPVETIIKTAKEITSDSASGRYLLFVKEGSTYKAYINVKEELKNSGYKYLIGNDNKDETIYIKGDNGTNVKTPTITNADGEEVESSAAIEIYSLDLFTISNNNIVTIPNDSRITIQDLQLIGGVGFTFKGNGTNVTETTEITVKDGKITTFNLDDGVL